MITKPRNGSNIIMRMTARLISKNRLNYNYSVWVQWPSSPLP
jgi:hypothetical protein